MQVKEPLFVLSSHLIDVESHEEILIFSFSNFCDTTFSLCLSCEV